MKSFLQYSLLGNIVSVRFLVKHLYFLLFWTKHQFHSFSHSYCTTLTKFLYKFLFFKKSYAVAYWIESPMILLPLRTVNIYTYSVPLPIKDNDSIYNAIVRLPNQCHCLRLGNRAVKAEMVSPSTKSLFATLFCAKRRQESLVTNRFLYAFKLKNLPKFSQFNVMYT